MSKSNSMKKAKPALDPRKAAYQRLLKAIQAIPGDSPRDQMRKFTAFALKVCVLNETVDLSGFGAKPLVAWCDETLLGNDVKGTETEAWCYEAGQAYGSAVETFEPFECILGRLFTEFVGSGKDDDCQFFTPWNAACFLAGFYVKPDKDNLLMCDPCCGAGTLLLAKLNQQAKEDAAVLRGVEVFANDRDPLCAAMTALQLLSNQLIWRMPIRQIFIECKDIITHYTESRAVFVSWMWTRFMAMSEEIRVEKSARGLVGGDG